MCDARMGFREVHTAHTAPRRAISTQHLSGSSPDQHPTHFPFISKILYRSYHTLLPFISKTLYFSSTHTRRRLFSAFAASFDHSDAELDFEDTVFRGNAGLYMARICVYPFSKWRFYRHTPYTYTISVTRTAALSPYTRTNLVLKAHTSRFSPI